MKNYCCYLLLGAVLLTGCQQHGSEQTTAATTPPAATATVLRHATLLEGSGAPLRVDGGVILSAV